MDTIPITLPTCARRSCNGVVVFFCALSIPAILPISVFMPTSVTTAFPRPPVTNVEENSMFLRSPKAVVSPSSISVCLLTGSDSPVRADSSTWRFTASIRRASAGIKSPASTKMTSPTTSSAEGMTSVFPFRMTLQVGEDIFFSASSDFSALLSCTTPRTAFSITTMKMTRLSTHSLGSTMRDITAATRRMMIKTSANCFKNLTIQGSRFFSSSSFKPNFSR